MLLFSEFFCACAGLWKTERTYHDFINSEVERSFTEYQVTPLLLEEKQAIIDLAGELELQSYALCPGFAISFATISAKGEQVAMNLKALFAPRDHIVNYQELKFPDVLPIASQIPQTAEAIQGLYLRDEGYSEAGVAKSQFTYLPSRQTLEMTTVYRQSIAVDQMRFVAADVRLRTIITYRRPPTPEPPQEITLVGFGVEHRQPLHSASTN
jgi:hypothetical protein